MSNRYRFHKKYYFKLFLIIFIISLLMISISFYSASFNYSANLSKEHQMSMAETLNNSAQNFDNLQKEIDMLYTLTWSNNAIHDFLHSSEVNGREEEQAVQYIKDLSHLNAMVDSIVLYNHQTDRYLSSRPDNTEMSLLLSTYLLDLKNFGSTNNLSKNKSLFIYHSRPNIETDRKVLSIIYYDIKPNEDKYSCISINLNVDKVADNIFANLKDTAVLANELGTVVCSNGTSDGVLTLGNVSRWTRTVSDGHKKTGYFDDIIDNEKHLVSYYKLSGYDWVLFYVSSEIGFPLLDLGNLKILSLFIFADILFSSAIAYIFTRRLYSPVNRIVKRIFNEYIDVMSNVRGSDEFSYVNNLLGILSSRIETLKAENTNYLSDIKSVYLHRILTSPLHSDAPEAEWNQYSIKVIPKELFVVIIKADDLESTSYSGKVYESMILGSADNFLNKNLNIEAVITKPEEVTLLLNFAEQDTDPYNSVISILREFQSFIIVNTGISVSISIAGAADSIGECSACYRRASELIKERFVIGYGKVIYQEYIDSTLSTGLSYPNELISELLANIRNADKASFLDNYGKLLNILRNYVYHDVASVLLQIITQCLHTMNSITINNTLLKIDFGEFDLIFSRMHTLDHTLGWFDNLFEEYLSAIHRMELLKSDKYYQEVKFIQDYIDKHFSDPNLSVESLSESVGYTANYFSKIFKKITGMCLHDYIKMVRINQAKDQLKNTKLTIREISDMTGFINQNYFYSSFKKETGLTPALYRSKCNVT